MYRSNFRTSASDNCRSLHDDTDLQDLRPHLLVCDNYLSGDRFLRRSCWQKIDKVFSCLHGIPVQYQKRCVVVGLVSRECALLGPSGDFEPGRGSLADARHVFKLTCPEGIPGYEDDFAAALENVAELLEVLPGNKQSDPFLSTTSNGVACLRFNSPIFQSKAKHFLYWVRHRINPRYPVPSEHASYLSEIIDDHAMSVYTVTKAGEEIRASDIGSVLVGSLVRVTFLLFHDIDNGLVTSIDDIVIL